MKLAIIPARGGSKRIPRKNIRPFNGVPIIARTIGTVLESGVFDRVVVSTDDEEIAQVARDAGAEVPFRRPTALSDDHTGTRPVVLHALETLEATDQKPASMVGCVYPTAVLVRPDRYREALAVVSADPTALVQTGLEYPHPIERAWRRRDDGRCERLHPEHATTRTQDLEPRYFDAGQFYMGTRDAWIAENSPPSVRMLILGRWDVVDIDTPEDWLLAERLHRAMGGGPPA